MGVELTFGLVYEIFLTLFSCIFLGTEYMFRANMVWIYSVTRTLGLMICNTLNFTCFVLQYVKDILFGESP